METSLTPQSLGQRGLLSDTSIFNFVMIEGDMKVDWLFINGSMPFNIWHSLIQKEILIEH